MKAITLMVGVLLGGVMWMSVLSVPAVSAGAPEGVHVVSEKRVTGFAHPESVAFRPEEKVLYVGQFGSVLKPTLKDGKGKISTVSLSGVVLEDRFLPLGRQALHKPKGIWVQGNRLWVTDIDVVWVFDVTTRQGRYVDLPEARFANDPTVVAGTLYVSDSGAGRIYRVVPADFLGANTMPRVDVLVADLAFSPNGLYPGDRGSLSVVGDALYTVSASGNVTMRSEKLGRLDGVAEVETGTFLMTDWASGSLLRWTEGEKSGVVTSGFKGPADFCVVSEGGKLVVVVPDLVASDIRLLDLLP
jgi:hypothetical protein